jgi:hypothetical protein
MSESGADSEAVTDILPGLDITLDDAEDQPGEELSDEEDNMSSDLTFSGKADTLGNILTHCRVLAFANPVKFGTDQRRSGFLGSLFRGPALDWLTTILKTTPKLLDNYEEFVEALKLAFDTSDDNQKLVAQSKWEKLSQTGSASQFFMKAAPLLSTLRYNDEAKVNLSRRKLKPKLQATLIGVEISGWEDFKKTVIDHDEAIFALTSNKKRNPKKPSGGTN